ncbi:MAG TPA: VOC family protein [Thermoanaerobaculia bacterium]|nr:VOC family protein [Thermoanaerobaculia bacterium]
MSDTSDPTAQLVAEIVVTDLPVTVDYLVALGFTVERTSETFAVLRWDSSRVFIAQDSAATVVERWVNIRVIVADVDAMWKKVARVGGLVVSTIGDRSYGLRDFIVRGPGGVEIRFGQFL